MPERFYQASTSFVIPEIKAGIHPPSVIPEIFNRESMFLNNLDPGLKIAGVTDLGMIELFRSDDLLLRHA